MIHARLVLCALLVLVACERAETPTHDAPAPTPNQAPPAPTSPTPAPPTSDAAMPTAVIVGIDSAVTSSGLPNHLRFSLVNTGEQAMTIELRELTLRAPIQALAIHELQLWPSGADAPTLAKPGGALTLEPSSEAELLVYLDSWAGDPLAEQYRFEGRFTIDGQPQTIPLTITRARREPLRGARREPLP